MAEVEGAQAVYLAVIVAVPAIIATVVPLIIRRMDSKARAAEKVQDAKASADEREQKWARDDRVEERMKQTAAAVTARAEETARLLVTSNQRLARASDMTNDKLDGIHGLVNSNYTAAMQAELDARQESLASLREIIELKKAAGKEPNAATLHAIAVAENRVTELKANLEVRAKQQKQMDEINANKLIASMQASSSGFENISGEPVKVSDERTAKATEKIAATMEEASKATTRAAISIEENTKKT